MHDTVKELLVANLEIILAAMNLVNSDGEATMMSLDQFQRATQEDGVLVRLMDHILRGMPETGLDLDKDLREFHRKGHDLHIVEWCIVLPGQNCDTNSAR